MVFDARFLVDRERCVLRGIARSDADSHMAHCSVSPVLFGYQIESADYLSFDDRDNAPLTPKCVVMRERSAVASTIAQTPDDTKTINNMVTLIGLSSLIVFLT